MQFNEFSHWNSIKKLAQQTLNPLVSSLVVENKHSSLRCDRCFPEDVCLLEIFSNLIQMGASR